MIIPEHFDQPHASPGFTVPLVMPWHVRTPTVFRYEDDQWIKPFLADGTLRLSSFRKFAQYPDEIAGDRYEGNATVAAYTGDGQTILIDGAVGTDVYVLSCTTYPTVKMRNAFNRNSAFVINSTIAFAAAVARHLPGFNVGFEGACTYRPVRNITKRFGQNASDFSTGGADALPDASAIFSAAGASDMFFLKTNRYQEQREYRFVWQVDHAATDFIEVKSPAAASFCRQIDPVDYVEQP